MGKNLFFDDMTGNFKPTIERVSKLQAAGAALETALGSLQREVKPNIVYHPSRTPSAEESRQILRVSAGSFIEHDLRATKDGIAMQNGGFTDRMKVWSVVANVGMLGEIMGPFRTQEIVEITRNRTKTPDAPVMDTIKGNLLLKDLTLEELQKLAKAGGEEVQGLGSFLDLIRNAFSGETKPGKLVADVKDADGVAGGVDLAVDSMKALVSGVAARQLEGTLAVVINYSYEGYQKSLEIVGKTATSMLAIPSSILYKQGADAFTNFAENIIVNLGVTAMVIKIAEIPYVQAQLDKKKPDTMIYVPPADSTNVPLIMAALQRNPSITSVQLDA